MLPYQHWWRHCLVFLITIATATSAQCPWHRENPDLQSSCLCAYNLGHELSVQCDMVDFANLLMALDRYARNTPLDLLYINNSTIGNLKESIFSNLRIHNIQMSGCRIKTVHLNAFVGQEFYLKNLNLQENELTEIPIDSLRPLTNLSLLDLSKNKIKEVPDSAFETLTKLSTLKLSDNNITISPGALRGLEDSLKNLNLKGTKQKTIPDAVRGLKNLAFLDLSQNSLRELPGPDNRDFDGLDALTALNLERNLLQSLGKQAFDGIKTTLSSLSLLNNLLPDFPTQSLNQLSELRVLDIGFNLLTELPSDAFRGNPSITLLALDGNPLSTVPYSALAHLNNTLRGLSLGGRFLHCDCRLKWVVNWIRNGDLQVTSRERNPQFCGSPPRFRDRGFYSIQPEELTCNEAIGVATVVNDDNDDILIHGDANPMPKTSTSFATDVPITSSTTSSTTTEKPSSTTFAEKSTSSITSSTSTTSTSTTSRTTKPSSNNGRSTLPPWRLNAQQRPPLVMGFPPSRKPDESTEVIVKNAYRQDNSVIIQWASETANILGFRVVYRLFGDKVFKQGPPLEASEREFKIKNVPSQECIVVCVISLEEINITPETVPYSQCREVRTVATSGSNMDKITIAASAAICGTIVIAVIVFIAASRRRSRKMHDIQQHKLGSKVGLPIAGLPVNCCTGLGPTASPGGPLSSLATLNAFNTHKDWDQVSAYSSQSIQRPRIYSMEQPSSLTGMQDEMRSHFGQKSTKPRSVADGQSQHSFSNSSGRYLTGFPSNLVTSRQDLRHSRQSLAMQSERLSRTPVHALSSHHTSNGGGGMSATPATHSITSSTRRTRPRSRSRDHHRPSSRYSTAGSTHTLNNYCDTSDNNWTDHDMDIYMARNPTRGGLVPL